MGRGFAPADTGAETSVMAVAARIRRNMDNSSHDKMGRIAMRGQS
jgi:hypothetical protein